MTEQTDAEFIAEMKALAEQARNAIPEFTEPVLTTPEIYELGQEASSAIPRLIGMVEGLTRERDDAEAERDAALAEIEKLKAAITTLTRKMEGAKGSTEWVRLVLRLVEVKPPDGDGLAWVKFATRQGQYGSFNLGTADKFATKVALEFERLRSAALVLTAAPEPPVSDGWRDIASAPERERGKSNDVLLGSFPKGLVAVGEPHRPPRDQFTMMDGTYYAPTHWRPLPAPPKGREGE